MARMHELACASLTYERVPNILRYTFNNLFIIYPLNGYFTIDSAPIYNIQDHPAFHFTLVNVKTIIFNALAGIYLLTQNSAHWREMVNNVSVIL